MRVIFPIKDTDTQYLGAMTIASVLKQAGHEVFGCAANIDTLRGFLSDGKQTVLAFATPTTFCLDYLKLNRALKTEFSEVFSLFGGWHPTYAPDMIEEDGVDAVCIGEGEWATAELCEQLDAGTQPSGIMNLWIKQANGEVERNPPRPLMQDLDALPLPDRDFMVSGAPEYYYIIASIVTQRSCPFACSFCVNYAFNEMYKGQNPQKRRRSVDHVIRELLQIKAKGKLEFVKFEDSIFALHPDWIEEFSEKYAAEINVPFTCFVRAEVATPSMMGALRRAGAVSVALGVETGDEQLRTDVFNKKITDEQLRQAVATIKNAGLKIRTHNILGIPGQSIEADIKTMIFNAELKPDYAACGFLQPYPGTAIYDRYCKEGLIPADLESYLTSIPKSYIEPVFQFPDAKTLMQERNLLRLFAVGVNFPWTIPLIRRLIRLPLTGFYRLVYGGWKSFAYFFKLWPISAKQLLVLVKRSRRMAS
jgi:anaerobic magnesium-protoporphyrin IX monomethyl ester cyclase